MHHDAFLEVDVDIVTWNAQRPDAVRPFDLSVVASVVEPAELDRYGDLADDYAYEPGPEGGSGTLSPLATRWTDCRKDCPSSWVMTLATSAHAISPSV